MRNTIDNTIQYVTSLTHCFCTGDINAAILAILLDLGFSVQCEGFTHLRLAIERKYICPQYRCQDIYDAVSSAYGGTITQCQIEQAIRSAIDSAWNIGAQEQWDLLFPSKQSSRRKRPSNLEFISRVACILELWASCRRSDMNYSQE